MSRDTNVTLRAYQPCDHDALVQLLVSTWESDAKDDSPLDFDVFLDSSTFSQVALRGDEVLGVVLARHDHPFHYAAGSNWLQEEEGVRRDLLAAAGWDDDDQVVLLIVSPAAKGLGLGRTLYDAAVAYLASCGAPHIHLGTDNSCDWGFYDHLGLQRLGTATPEPGFECYLYGTSTL